MALPSAGYDKAIYQAPSGDITGFTAIIDAANFSTDFWSDVNSSDGTRARFAKDTTPTEIASDPIDFDDVGESGHFRCLIGNSFTADTAATRTIRAYSPNTRNTSYGPTDTYGQYNAYASHWEAYYPLEDLNDRTSNGNDLTAFNTPTSGVTGQVADSYSFASASSEYLGLATAPITVMPLTLMAWFKPTEITDEHVLISIADQSEFGVWFNLDIRGDLAGDPIRAVSRNGPQVTANTSTGYSANVWNHGAAVFTSSTSRHALLNAGGKGTNTTSSTPANLDNMAIGRIADSTPSDYMNGGIDEVQIHSAALSDDWILEEYKQVNDNASFWSTWVWTAAGGTTHQLSGSLNSASQLTGLLNLTQRLSGSMNSKSTTSGVLRLIQRLTGSLNSSSVISGTLKLTQRLSGAINSKSVLSGALRLIQRLSGSLNSKSQISGNLSVPTTHQLSGSILSRSHLSGTLTDDTIPETLDFNINRTESLDFSIDNQIESDFNIDKITQLDYDITME